MNQLRDVTKGMGQMLQRLTSRRALTVAGNVSGRRIVVSMDGGCVRLRERRRGKTKKGRKRFAAQWREPRLFIIYAVDDERVQQLIDFWHAMEYLGKIAESKSLLGVQKAHWLTIQKKRLLRGEIGSVVEEIKRLIGSRKTKEQTTWLNDFIINGLTHRRMDYSRSRGSKTPIGSGAIESAVRRVINLRVKSNAVYWLRDNAETIIRLRAWIKAGRAEELFKQTTCITPDLAI